MDEVLEPSVKQACLQISTKVYSRGSNMRFMKAVIFYPMLWLRGIINLIGRFVAGLFLLGFIFVCCAKLLGVEYVRWWDVGLIGLMSFVIFLLLEFYDQILLRLNPTDNILILE